MTGKTVEDYRREMEEQHRKHDELLKTLDIPAYNDRSLQAQWVQKKEVFKDGSGAITGTSGWTAGAPKEVLELLEEGDPYILETKGFNEISGWIIKGQWYARKSDQDIQRAHDEWVEKTRREHEEFVEKNRADWEQREAALPDWAKKILQRNRAEVDDFDMGYMGWGYTLIALELAVLYSRLGDRVKNSEKTIPYAEEPEHIKEFHRTQGTSGNQAGWAFSLARAHLRGDL